MWLKIAALALLGTVMGTTAPAQSPTPPARLTANQLAEAASLVRANSYPFRIAGGRLVGSGADFLRHATVDAQFLLLGEGHHDRDTPIFARALFRDLRARHGFEYLVVEIDPVAVETIVSAAYRGNLAKIANLSMRYPRHIGFSSDQDLQLYAEASGLGRSRIAMLWGIEQAQGADRYLEELAVLAPNATTKAEAERLLALATTEREEAGAFLHNEPRTIGWLQALKASFGAKPGSRAYYLLTYLLKSAEIYSYNRRANEGESVGLFNNTVREALFKEHFLGHYRKAAEATKRLPKAMFKMGGWHMYRGKSPGGAYTIGNFAHEFAVANGMKAYGISVLAVGGFTQSLSDFPAWMRPILPETLPPQPLVIDLDALKPDGRKFTGQVSPADQWQLRDFLHGHNALIILPSSAKASWQLTGFKQP